MQANKGVKKKTLQQHEVKKTPEARHEWMHVLFALWRAFSVPAVELKSRSIVVSDEQYIK